MKEGCKPQAKLWDMRRILSSASLASPGPSFPGAGSLPLPLPGQVSPPHGAEQGPVRAGRHSGEGLSQPQSLRVPACPTSSADAAASQNRSVRWETATGVELGACSVSLFCVVLFYVVLCFPVCAFLLGLMTLYSETKMLISHKTRTG